MIRKIWQEVSLLKRILSLFPALACAALLICSGIHTAWAAGPAAGSGRSYYIMVNRAQSTVTVYEPDEEGRYTVPVKAMVCSTGRKGHATPLGTYSIGGRWTWVHMFDDSYGQYCTQIKGNILFHSVCYAKRDPSTLITEEYNGLGAPASLGCVRLQTADAKWIYDNVGQGAKVTVYDDADSPGPLGKPDKLVDYISPEQANGWDPTDPREENPWREILPDPDSGREDPGPSRPAPPPADQAVSYALMARTLYGLSGETGLTQPSELTDWAAGHRLLDGMAGEGFDPAAPMTRQELAAMLYRYETAYLCRRPQGGGSLARFSDGEEVAGFARDAMAWAVGTGLIQGTSEDTLHPADYANQDQLAIILERYGLLAGPNRQRG